VTPSSPSARPQRGIPAALAGRHLAAALEGGFGVQQAAQAVLQLLLVGIGSKCMGFLRVR
jgi:hypothetical protein